MDFTPDEFKERLQLKLRQDEILNFREILIDSYVIKKLCSKFSDIPIDDLSLALRETVRFLYLSARCNGALFFPGNQLIDDLWHAFIVETQFYSKLCKSLGSSDIIHHSGLEYEDYKNYISHTELQEEHLSWLASYTFYFGKIDSDSFKMLPMAKMLATRYSVDLHGLNGIAHTISKATLASDNVKVEGWEKFMKTIKDRSHELDSDFTLNGEVIYRVVQEAREVTKGNIFEFSNDQLIDIFSASICTGFTLWQHLAAVERLRSHSDWQVKNPILWESINKGDELVGLGITHLAKPTPTITGVLEGDNYTITGFIPWVSGFDFYKYFVIGFVSNNQNVVALIESKELFLSASSEVQRIDLAALAGTGSVELKLRGLKIPVSSVLSVTEIGKPTRSATTTFIFPEIGIGYRALSETKLIVNHRSDEKSQSLMKLSDALWAELDSFKESSKNIESEKYFEKQILRDKLIRDCLKLLALAEGGKAVKVSGLSWLFAKQILLLDVFIQPIALVRMKLERINV